MAVTPTDRGGNSRNTGAESTIIASPTSTIAAGKFAVLGIAYDNSGGNGADPYSSITDSVGNTWVSRASALADPGAANAGCTTRIFTSVLTTAITSGDTVTVSFSATTVARAWAFMEFASSSATVRTNGGTSGAGTTATNVSCGTARAGEYIVSVVAVEQGVTTCAASGSGFSTAQTYTVGAAAASGMAIGMSYAGPTSAGAVTNTWGTWTSTDWAHCYIIVGNAVPTMDTSGSTADASTFATPNPQIRCKGTDTEGNELTYELVVDNAFDRYDGSGIASSLGNNAAAFDDTGQAFQIAGSLSVTAASFWLSTTSGSGNMTARIFASTGTYGTDARPTGAALGTSDAINANTLTGTLTETQFTFSTPVALTAGTYCVVLTYGGANNVNIALDSAGTHGGNYCYKFGGSYSGSSAGDIPFRIYSATSPMYDRGLSTGSGWADITNGADSDPFASGDQVGYTVVTSLVAGSYSWYARTKDSGTGGGNQWSAWTAVRSLTVVRGGSFFFG